MKRSGRGNTINRGCVEVFHGEYLIVDGYNIINDWPSLKALFSENVEAARDKLIEIMAEYRAYKGINVMVVFDGHRVKDNPGSSSYVKESM